MKLHFRPVVAAGCAIATLIAIAGSEQAMTAFAAARPVADPAPPIGAAPEAVQAALRAQAQAAAIPIRASWEVLFAAWR